MSDFTTDRQEFDRRSEQLALALIVACAREDDGASGALLADQPAPVVAYALRVAAAVAALYIHKNLELVGQPADDLFVAFEQRLAELSN